VSWERHYPALRRLPEFQVRAVCDIDETRARQIAAMYRAPLIFTDFRDMVRRSDIDAVAVLTGTPSHAEAGIAVLAAGKHLFIEKPLALTLEEADRLVDAGRQSNRTAQVCFNLRWHRLVRQAKAILESGALGRVKAIRSVYTHNRTGADAPVWHRRIASGGGVVFNEGVHHFDLWRHLLGAEVERVYAVHVPSPVYEDETCIISATLDGGILASGVLSFLTGPNNELEIFGEKARLLISLYRFDGLQLYSNDVYPGESGDRLRRGVRALAALPALIADARNGGGFQATFTACWRGFAKSIREKRQPLCTMEDGRSALAIGLAVTAFLSTGQPTDATVGREGEITEGAECHG
jgi:predicted dehydrogenase